MMQWKKILIVTLASLLLSLGCSDMNDLNRRVLLVAISLDVAENDELLVTAHYLRLIGGRAEGQVGEPSLDKLIPSSLTVTSRNLGSGIDKLRERLPGDIFMGSLRGVLISDALARRGISEVFNYFRRQPKLFKSIPVAVVATQEGERAGTDSGPAVASFISAAAGGGTVGVTLSATPLWKVLDAKVNPFRPLVLPIITWEDPGVNIIGQGVFRRDKMVSVVPRSESPLLFSVRQALSTYLEVESTVDSEPPLVVFFRTIRTSVTLDPDGNSAAVTIHGTAYLIEGPVFSTDAVIHDELSQQVNRDLSRRMKSMLETLYQKNTDVLALSEQARRRTYSGILSDTWTDRLPEMKFRVNARITILHGMRGS